MAKAKASEPAVERGWITKDQWYAAKALVEKGDPRRIELIYYQKSWIDAHQLFELVKIKLLNKARLNPTEKVLLEDILLAGRAVKRKWLRRPKMCSIFRYELELLAQGTQRRFLEIAQFEGVLTEEQCRIVEEEFQRNIFICPSCSYLISIGKYKGEGKFTCPRCKGVFFRSKRTSNIYAISSSFAIPTLAFADPTVEKPPRFRYRILKKIAQGGIGSVYKVYDEDLQRTVALKVIRQDKNYSERMIHKFVREARILAKLEHPHIVPIHEIGFTTDGRVYFVMKYVRGTSLHEVLDLLRKEDPEAWQEYPLERLLQIFLSICQAVSFAHAQGIIHRDLKPANVMLGEFGEVLVMDWGLAKDLQESANSPYGEMIGLDGEPLGSVEGRLVGTVHYVPPEQVFHRPEEVDERSDVYALGAILYEMLTFYPPFIGGSKEELLQDVLEKEPRRPRKIAKRKVPSDLEAICLKALSKQKSRRYQSVQELYEDVQNFLLNRPVLAAPGGVFQRTVKWAKRNKLLFFALAIVFLSALILSPLIGIGWKAAILTVMLVASAVYPMVFHAETKREVELLRRKVKKLEREKQGLIQSSEEPLK